MSTKGNPPGSGLHSRSKVFSNHRQYLILVLLITSIAIAVTVNLIFGIEAVYTHFFYLPIILTALWYPRKGVYLAIVFALLHILLGIQATGAIVPSTIIRATMFIAVALVLGTLSGARQKLYSRVRSSERELRLLLESTDEGIYGIGTQGQCIFINRSAAVMFGYTPEELIGKDIHSVIHCKNPDGTPLLTKSCPILESMRTGTGTRKSDEVFWHKNGTTFPVEYSSYPIRENGTILGAVVTFYDITSRKKTEEELLDARKQAELFVDLLGHDINNLNQLGMGYLEVALDTMKLDAEGRNILQRALDAMRSSSRLIENVRKIQQVRYEEQRSEVIDLGMMLSDVAAEFSAVPGREVSIIYKPVPSCCITASQLIKEAFRNLISNAIKHSTGPVTIWMTISSTTLGGKPCYRVDIEDNGPGIPDDLKEKLFTRKVRGLSRTAGSGLGLFLVRTLVEHAGGRVWVEDRIPGDHTQGSRFVVLLPSHQA